MALQDDTPPATASDALAPPSPDFGEHAASIVREMRGLVHDHVDLVTLETRLCFHNILKMVVVAILAALVLAGAWFALIGAGVFVLIEAGLAPALAMALLAVANVLLAIGGWMLIKRTSTRLGWPATQRALKVLPQ